jgi:ornithine cyclodeaminase/alanine dehydrogenase-like protein (mu-crystallin family)
MAMAFRILTEADVKSVLTMDDLIATMESALKSFSTKQVEQPVRAVISVDGNHAFFGTMPAYVRGADATGGSALGAKLVTVFEQNHAKGLPSHLASILLLDPETGALKALLDGRYITEARTAAVSAVSSRLLARKTAKALAIIGSGVQAKSHLEALSRVHALKQVTVWSPNQAHRERFVTDCLGSDPGQRGSTAVRGQTPDISAVGHAGEAVVGADVIVLATSSPEPVIESGWVKPGAHVICVGACRPNQREIDPALTARAKFFVDSRKAALVESGDLVMGIQEGRFGPEHIAGELGELVAGTVPGRTSDTEITIFKSLGMAVEDVTAAELAYRRAAEKKLGREMEL